MPAGDIHRFGGNPANSRQRRDDRAVGELDKRLLTPRRWHLPPVPMTIASPTSTSRSGSCVDKLRRSGVLERTWLIIVSDHGESFGEHAGIFCHGTSLYQTELHVPLVIMPPGGSDQAGRQEPVSLRDLAATIVDVTGQAAGSAFPGNSLAGFWNGTTRPRIACTGRYCARRSGTEPERPGNRDTPVMAKADLAAGSAQGCGVDLHSP